ncbi:MAG TPA: alpha/beta hydrolase-fold protein [Chitinophagaceae bacterium]|jgi:esterase/lipase superfamily enzyme|nr:alpha/beta hydrolase-fold protein [Chitinophagaceae bacterium]HMX77665.1 alpha/beta hydrolase-fold protein [Chitinophagaceae bacterium]HNA19080.1 alpha/beta hydrolase-fold protein [Chitinophagaceae bacterium]HNA92016.1 alpha/beta hydrolase-fold protein [Chitinophagaceae bacterium]HNA95806.1 alpha/beta hydrolase-fold protein [Chitinophagaceae bacterium]
MKRELTSWFSPSLNKEMPIASYGDFGFALLLVPTAAADYLEYERFQLMDHLAPFIDAGKVRVFSIDSINNESWLNNNMAPRDKAIRHQQWNSYVFNEVVPFIRTNTSQETPIITCGASFGALHSMNLFLKRPDLINGVIAMSGVYDLSEYTKGYFDDDVYFNSPFHYMSNLTDHSILEQIRKSGHIHILTGSGNYEDPAASGKFAKILYDKGIWYELDVWGQDWPHDWNTWRAMLPHYLGSKF